MHLSLSTGLGHEFAFQEFPYGKININCLLRLRRDCLTCLGFEAYLKARVTCLILVVTACRFQVSFGVILAILTPVISPLSLIDMWRVGYSSIWYSFWSRLGKSWAQLQCISKLWLTMTINYTMDRWFEERLPPRDTVSSIALNILFRSHIDVLRYAG